MLEILPTSWNHKIGNRKTKTEERSIGNDLIKSSAAAAAT